MGIIPAIGIALFFLCLSFLFSGLETGLISLNRLRLEAAARSSRRSAELLKFIRQPDKILGTTLIGNNIVNVILASFTTFVAQTLVNRSGSWYFDPRWTALGVAAVVFIFGELLPKSLFRDHADAMVPALFPVLKLFYNLLRPFVYAVTWLNRALEKLLRIDTASPMAYLTRDDLAFLISQTASDPESEPHLEMIEDALEFNEQRAYNVMIPRTDVVAIEADASAAEILELAAREGFTRYPVYDQNLDNIIGVLIIYDLLRTPGSEGMNARQLVHEPFFIPENTDIDIVLRDMQQHHLSMAIIVDSFGGTAGIITMEDILEEIVGDISDEFDTEEDAGTDVDRVGPNTWIVAADVEIDKLNGEYDMALPEGDYETVAGLILDRLERIPHPGQILDAGPYRLQVLQTTDRKISRVKIHLSEAPETDTQNEK